MSFDAASFVQQKFLALAAHRSAFGVTEEMVSRPLSGAREMFDAFRPVFEREVRPGWDAYCDAAVALIRIDAKRQALDAQDAARRNSERPNGDRESRKGNEDGPDEGGIDGPGLRRAHVTVTS